MTTLQPHAGDTSLPDGWTIEPLTGTIGAIIHGVDLREALDPSQVTAIRSALLGFRVVFFRDQHITPTQQVAFARNFGTLTAVDGDQFAHRRQSVQIFHDDAGIKHGFAAF